MQASELFPTEMRGVAHGFSAAVGKVGALSADIILGLVGGFRAAAHAPEHKLPAGLATQRRMSSLKPRAASDSALACSASFEVRFSWDPTGLRGSGPLLRRLCRADECDSCSNSMSLVIITLT